MVSAINDVRYSARKASSPPHGERLHDRYPIRGFGFSSVRAVRRTPMPAPGEDRFFTELRGSTAELARIIDGDLERLSSSGVTASARAHHRACRRP
jgi:hypothetical protein